MLCFSPASTPGVSMSVSLVSSWLCSEAHSRRVRKPEPNLVSPVNGLSACITRALPGTMRSSSPYMMATNRSVVGSGPMRMPGKSRCSRYLHAGTHGVP